MKKNPILIVVGVIVLIVAGIFGARYWQFASTHSATDDAYLTSDVIQISPQVSGTVMKVHVADNEVVKAGQLMVELDDSTYRAAVDQAQANLDAAIAQAKGAGISVALTQETGTAVVTQAEGALEQSVGSIASAKSDAIRSQAAVETAIANASSADANTGNARAALKAAIANKKRNADAVNAAKAQVDAAKAAVRAAQAIHDKNQHDVTRYSNLVAKGAVSKQIYDDSISAELTSKAQLENARAVVQQKEADLGAARQQLDAADDTIAQGQAQLLAAQAQAAAAKTGISAAQAQHQASLSAVVQAEARHHQATGQLSQANTSPRQVEVSKSAHAQALAKIEQSRAALATAKLQLSYCKIYAPADGRVNKKSVEEGALVQPGTPLMALVPNNDIWVVANFKETQLTQVRPGQEAELDIDAVPGRTFKGRVDSIASATGSTFALLPPDNATGNFVKVVQRVPVKITLDSGQPDLDRLQAGMSVVATVKTK
jgi:membrane fusion protein (multidrug efflux system)